MVVACAIFVLFGAAPSREMLRERHRLRNGFIGAIVVLVIVAMPLVWHAVDVARATIESTTGAPLVREWIGARDLEVTSWSIEGDAVTLDLAGPEAPADAAPLAASLAEAFGRPVDLEVNYVPATVDRVTAAP